MSPLPVVARDPDLELFCLEYVANGGNATRAYLRVAPGVKPSSARVSAHEWMQREAVQARIAEIRAEQAAQAEVGLADIVARLKALAFSDLRDVVEWDSRAVAVKPSDELTPEAAYALTEVSMEDTQHGRKIRVRVEPGRVAALAALAELLGLQPPKRVQVDETVRWIVEVPGTLNESEWRERYARPVAALAPGAAA